jgi:hypothetical protein
MKQPFITFMPMASACLLMLAFACNLSAQKISVSINAPDTILQGSTHTLKISIENLPESALEIPDFVGLKVLMGPSRQSQISIINGQRFNSATYQYMVLADQPGLAYVPPISIDHDGKSISSEELKLFVTEDPDYVPPAEQKPDQLKAPSRRRPTVKL